jgi:hypothetical protein
VVVLPDPIVFQIVPLGPNTDGRPAPCCAQVKANFHLHVTANELRSVDQIVLRVTRTADKAVYTQTMEAKDIAYAAARGTAAAGPRWEIAVNLFATFEVPNEGQEFTIRIELRLATKTKDAIDVTVEPRMIVG